MSTPPPPCSVTLSTCAANLTNVNPSHCYHILLIQHQGCHIFTWQHLCCFIRSIPDPGMPSTEHIHTVLSGLLPAVSKNMQASERWRKTCMLFGTCAESLVTRRHCQAGARAGQQLVCAEPAAAITAACRKHHCCSRQLTKYLNQQH